MKSTQRTSDNHNSFDSAVFQDPPPAYRSLPFWSWNDKLDPEELRRQIREMKRVGIGGFFMHTRQGLETPYMGPAFLDAVEVAAEEAEALGMEAWCYDENGWPSGTADGVVPRLGAEFQQKSLQGIRLAAGQTEQLHTISRDEEFLFLLVREKGAAAWQLQDPSSAEQAVWEEGIAVMCRINPYYIDVLSDKAIGAFLDACHEVYFERLGERFRSNGIPGIFTDEFKFSGFPWSEGMEAEFEAIYGDTIYSAIGWLLTEAAGESPAELDAAFRSRYNFWKLVTGKFQQSVTQITDWCNAHGWQLTGHFMGEDSLRDQMSHTAGVMPLYETMAMPGIDLLGRDARNVMLPKQASSVARQMGRDFVITETFGCAGWNLNFRDMKKIAEWQFVLGVNRLCQHLQSYSIRGVRKRDYPPSLYIQQPWWDVYAPFNDYFARLTYLLTLGQADPGILVIHPIRTAWLNSGESSQWTDKLQKGMEATASSLLALQRDFDYGDEAIIARHGRVEDGAVYVGRQRYDTIIIDGSQTLEVSTYAFLQEAAKADVSIIVIGEPPTRLDGVFNSEAAEWFASDAVILVPDINSLVSEGHVKARADWTISHDTPSEALSRFYVQQRQLPGMKLLYAVHTGTTGSISIQLSQADTRRWTELCLEDGTESEADLRELNQEIVFAPGESKLFVVRDNDDKKVPAAVDAARKSDSTVGEIVPLDENWDYRLSAPNVLTLDYASYRIEEGDWAPPTYVLNIQEQCIGLKRPVPVELIYSFETDAELLKTSDSSLWRLAIERPEHWHIELNGQTVEAAAADGWMGGDRSFPALPIGRFVQPGSNEIRLKGQFYCNEETYRYFGIAGANLAPIRNKLIFDVEIESIYVLGPFAAQPAGAWEETERSALWTSGPFLLTEQPKRLQAADATRQGLAFYSGQIVFNQTVVLTKNEQKKLQVEGKRLILQWEEMLCPAFRVKTNGIEAGTVLWGDNRLELNPASIQETLELEIELFTSGRNTFGPHHHLKGEVSFVGPTSFTDKIGWVDAGMDQIWTDRYCMVSFGLTNLRLMIV